MSDALAPIRDRIDAIDRQILELFNERAKQAQLVAQVKLAAGETDTMFYRPEREAQVLRRIKELNPGPLSGEEVARLFRELMSACLALEQPMRIAYLGPAGTFTQAAALKQFGHSVLTLPISTIDEIFREVEAGGADYGVVPVENSTEGVVTHTLDQFVRSPLMINGEVELRIHHHLMSRAEGFAQVKRIYAHRQALGQCREWLDTHVPHAERIDVSSNAEAARMVASEEGAAAVAGETAAELYGLRILAHNIEDQPDNTTRFLVLGRKAVGPSGDDKTSLLVSAANKPGALFKLLEPLARSGVSMTRIESRPSHQGLWAYLFFLDIDGHHTDAGVQAAIEELRGQASLFKVLGSYPKSVL